MAPWYVSKWANKWERYIIGHPGKKKSNFKLKFKPAFLHHLTSWIRNNQVAAGLQSLDIHELKEPGLREKSGYGI